MNGILLVDKPAAWTSMDVCAKLRGVLHEKRIGHSGTLDPMATGLLVVFLGRATRAVEFAEAQNKEYLAGLQLGITTDTQDTSGNVLSSIQADVSRDELEKTLEHFRGAISQIPPMYSAVKIGGKKLYEIARKGGSVERKSREIMIHEIELLSYEGARADIRVSCSKGTYIRTLCNDIGVELRCGGAMCSLRRISAGKFSIEDALTLDEIIARAESGDINEVLLGVDTLFEEYEPIVVSARREREMKNGVRYPTSLPEKTYRVYSESGEFLALARPCEGKMITVKSFFEVK